MLFDSTNGPYSFDVVICRYILIIFLNRFEKRSKAGIPTIRTYPLLLKYFFLPRTTLSFEVMNVGDFQYYKYIGKTKMLFINYFASIFFPKC